MSKVVEALLKKDVPFDPSPELDLEHGGGPGFVPDFILKEFNDRQKKEDSLPKTNHNQDKLTSTPSEPSLAFKNSDSALKAT
jgi:hypothetical protein